MINLAGKKLTRFEFQIKFTSSICDIKDYTGTLHIVRMCVILIAQQIRSFMNVTVISRNDK